MRFNELMAGVRGDIAVKVFGEEFEPMLRAANEIAAILRALEGAADVRVEQATGLPFLEIKVDKKEIARRGLSLAVVQDLIGAAVGGREAGVVFEGDRRFEIVVRLPESQRAPISRRCATCRSRCRAGSGRGAARRPFRSRKSPRSPRAKGRTRSAGKTASGASSSRPMCAAATSRSLVAEAQARIAEQVRLPAGYWITWGGQFENLIAARQRLTSWCRPASS